MVKVGDKIRIVNPYCMFPVYKKGDVYTVNAVGGTLVYVEEMRNALLHQEYEVIEPIKVGDTVTLIDKPWETEVWGLTQREFKKDYIKRCGKVWQVTDIRVGISNPRRGVVCDATNAAGNWIYIIPLELLSKVDSKLDGKNTDFACIDDLPDQKHRYNAEQIAEAQRIIGEIVANMGEHTGIDFWRANNTTCVKIENQIFRRMDCSNCSPNDEFNQTIGRMVALCKVTNTKLPDWI